MSSFNCLYLETPYIIIYCCCCWLVVVVVVVVVVVIGKDLLCMYDFCVKFVAYKPRHWLSRRFVFFYCSQHFVLHFDTVRK